MAKNYVENERDVIVVGGFISPVHDQYKKKGLIDGKHRLAMCHGSVKDSTWLSVDEWEITRDEYSRTKLVLQHFNDELALYYNQDIRVLFLCGSDLLETLTNPNIWRPEDVELILQRYGVVVFGREGVDVLQLIESHEILKKHAAHIQYVPELIRNNISSTKIRNFVAQGYSVKYLIQQSALEYISDHHLYRTELKV